MTSQRPSRSRLFEIASEQRGYFNSKQAHEAGYSTDLIKHHVKRGNFTRIRRGLYRLHPYPTAPDDHVVEAWLEAGPKAVVSHESALAVHGLSDVVPSKVHVTVPRSHRMVVSRVPRGIDVHTTEKSLTSDQIVKRGPLRVTTPARSIIDAAEAGTAPEQIILAIRQSLQEGMTTMKELQRLAAARSKRVLNLVTAGIREAQTA